MARAVHLGSTATKGMVKAWLKLLLLALLPQIIIIILRTSPALLAWGCPASNRLAREGKPHPRRSPEERKGKGKGQLATSSPGRPCCALHSEEGKERRQHGKSSEQGGHKRKGSAALGRGGRRPLPQWRMATEARRASFPSGFPPRPETRVHPSLDPPPPTSKVSSAPCRRRAFPALASGRRVVASIRGSAASGRRLAHRRGGDAFQLPSAGESRPGRNLALR